MVQVTLTYVIKAINTGVAHDLICGCSLLNPNTGDELYYLPWWRIFNVPTGGQWTITIAASGDISAGTYLAIARAWETFSGGTKVNDLRDDASGAIVGALYQAGSGALTGILDEATQTLTIGVAGVSAEILNFSITI